MWVMISPSSGSELVAMVRGGQLAGRVMEVMTGLGVGVRGGGSMGRSMRVTSELATWML